ncbi:hypothetical protein IAI18_11005 [Acetobacteraceae bacterium H6797]|nr:hypothetical protein [Acetobacteraceae bacterium H6797]
MFVDLDGNGPWREEPATPRLTPAAQKALVWVIAANALLLLIAPIGGATVVEAVIALFF